MKNISKKKEMKQKNIQKVISYTKATECECVLCVRARDGFDVDVDVFVTVCFYVKYTVN